MANPFRAKRLIIATAVASVGALGIGVAGAVTGGAPVPNPAAGDHPSTQATSNTLPDAVNASSGHPATPDITNNPDTPSDAGKPGVGVAPSADNLSTALTHTEGTPGNTVLNDLLTTAPGADRGATISGDAKDLTPPTPSLPEQAQTGLNHKP